MKKLYKVEITRTICVLADDNRRAERIALSSEGEESANDPDMICAREVKSLENVPVEWHDGYPYGDENCDSTVAELVKRMV